MLRARVATLVGSLLGLLLAAGPASRAASLPPHGPLRIVIVSDEVNPYGLPPAELTQPGDISAALLMPGSGLNLDPAADGVVEIPTDEIERATELLSRARCDPTSYDVVIYFAHRIPERGGDETGRQAAFTAAVARFLETGGGFISFHHGSYFTTGKAGILDLIGATASGAVRYDRSAGQNVIDVAPGHFVTTNGVSYAGRVAYADPTRGVAAGDYELFNNTPDERYLSFEINPTAGDFELLFASDYVEAGTTHLLGFTHRRPEWSGVVVGYQPGENQPNALDDLDGNDFQILANAIVYAAGLRAGPPPEPIRLLATRGGVGSELRLEWTGGRPDFCVYRGSSASGVEALVNNLGSTFDSLWSDAPPGGSFYYRVTAR